MYDLHLTFCALQMTSIWPSVPYRWPPPDVLGPTDDLHLTFCALQMTSILHSAPTDNLHLTFCTPQMTSTWPYVPYRWPPSDLLFLPMTFTCPSMTYMSPTVVYIWPSVSHRSLRPSWTHRVKSLMTQHGTASPVVVGMQNALSDI